MRVLIVHAHHEPASFNAALTFEAVTALKGAGHEVALSDLYEMAFDPVSDRRNFLTIADPATLKQQAEESHASANNGYVSGAAGISPAAPGAWLADRPWLTVRFGQANGDLG